MLRARIAEIAGLKRRYDQLPLDHWSEVIADAIRERLEHSALTLHITGVSYRGVKARKLANKNKGWLRIVAYGSAADPSQVGPNSGNRLVPKRQILQQLSAYSLERVTLSMKRSLGK